jgi:hypothetical protein
MKWMVQFWSNYEIVEETRAKTLINLSSNYNNNETSNSFQKKILALKRDLKLKNNNIKLWIDNFRLISILKGFKCHEKSRLLL